MIAPQSTATVLMNEKSSHDNASSQVQAESTAPALGTPEVRDEARSPSISEAATITDLPTRGKSSELDPTHNGEARIAALLTRKAGRDQFLVTFSYRDRQDPKQFPSWRKWQIILVAFAAEMWANVISSIYAVGVPAVAADFGVSETAARVPQAVYLYGFAVGPVLLAPLSEDYGRWVALVPSLVILGLCQLACALAPNLGTLIAFRLIGGFFASATFNSVGLIDDMWSTEDQSWPTNTFALSAEIGAVLGPIFSGVLFERYRWRWLFGVSGIVTGALLILWCLTVPETRAGVLLSRRAEQNRKEMNDDRFYALYDKLRSQHTAKTLVREMLVRPLWMLFTEPIVFSLALFDGYAYALVYCFMESIPLVYSKLDITHQGLPFVGIAIGFSIGFVAYFGQRWWEQRAARRSGRGRVPPEERLAWGSIAGILFPTSMFYFAWTSTPRLPPIVSIIALSIFGIGSHVIFICVSSYTITSYGPYAASAVAAQSFLREFLSGSVTLVAAPLYHGLSNAWASTLLAFLAIPLSVVPLVLYRYGSRIRARSSFAEEIARAAVESREQAEEDEAHWSREQTFATRATAGAATGFSRGRTMTVQMSRTATSGLCGGLRGSVIPERDRSTGTDTSRTLTDLESEKGQRVTFSKDEAGPPQVQEEDA